MAGDWIKMRTNLHEDPAVIALAEILKIEEDEVIGKLHRFWSWADQHLTTGNAPGVTKTWVDRYLRCNGFAQALQLVGWLEDSAGGINLLKFDKHMAQGAKTRALTARRAVVHKGKKGNAPTVTTALPEKRREDNKKENAAHSPRPPPAKRKGKPGKPRTPDPIWGAVCAIWFPSGVSPTDKTRIGKVVRDLKAHGATPEQIDDRIRRYRAEWPDSADTPEAIVKHWDRFAADKTVAPGIDTSWCGKAKQ